MKIKNHLQHQFEFSINDDNNNSNDNDNNNNNDNNMEQLLFGSKIKWMILLTIKIINKIF